MSMRADYRSEGIFVQFEIICVAESMFGNVWLGMMQVDPAPRPSLCPLSMVLFSSVTEMNAPSLRIHDISR